MRINFRSILWALSPIMMFAKTLMRSFCRLLVAASWPSPLRSPVESDCIDGRPLSTFHRLPLRHPLASMSRGYSQGGVLPLLRSHRLLYRKGPRFIVGHEMCILKKSAAKNMKKLVVFWIGMHRGVWFCSARKSSALITFQTSRLAKDQPNNVRHILAKTLPGSAYDRRWS
jgi:hypothetical protein